MSWMQAPDGLEKLRIELPNHPHVSAETLWAKALGSGLYEVRNIPFHAYGLNFLDVVEAMPRGPGEFPVVRRVHRRSGHRTLRVCFTEEAVLDERLPSLMQLQILGATFEGASQSYYALDIEPLGSYRAICEQLQQWQAEGMLSFETCETRDPASFGGTLLI